MAAQKKKISRTPHKLCCGDLDALHLEIESNIRNIVQGALVELEPNEGMGVRVLVTDNTRVKARGNLRMSSVHK